ncbi:hypothetical protein Y032_0415g1055 [Ancylostoma ceylanicum]|uniref:Uncharacterized protein n=1 Tax=Ancylostoma ceylanicum TaxID=53326 RepID=A0A016X1U0_9BILA|nr:hypothetical protein Y032_0415g1055 [Ancylostoma ceylanicum]
MWPKIFPTCTVCEEVKLQLKAVSQLRFDFEQWVSEESRGGADYNGIGIPTQKCKKSPSLIVSFWSKRPAAASKA